MPFQLLKVVGKVREMRRLTPLEILQFIGKEKTFMIINLNII